MKVIRAGVSHTFLAVWGTSFPPAVIGSVGYRILNSQGLEVQARQQPEVAFGNNVFGVRIQWPTSFSGYIRWDIGNNPATYIHEEFYVLASSYIGLTFTQIPRSFMVQFHPSMIPAVDVGYAIYDGVGAPLVPRTTAGVAALGNGQWGTNLTFMTPMNGYVVWDMDGLANKQAVEEVTVLTRPPDMVVPIYTPQTVQIGVNELTVVEPNPQGGSPVVTRHIWSIDLK